MPRKPLELSSTIPVIQLPLAVVFQSLQEQFWCVVVQTTDLMPVQYSLAWLEVLSSEMSLEILILGAILVCFWEIGVVVFGLFDRLRNAF